MSYRNRIIHLIIKVIDILILGIPLKFAWNFALVPAIDGLNNIVYSQSICIVLVSVILFSHMATNTQDTDE
jgi:hypothetical protein